MTDAGTYEYWMQVEPADQDLVGYLTYGTGHQYDDGYTYDHDGYDGAWLLRW